MSLFTKIECLFSFSFEKLHDSNRSSFLFVVWITKTFQNIVIIIIFLWLLGFDGIFISILFLSSSPLGAVLECKRSFKLFYAYCSFLSSLNQDPKSMQSWYSRYLCSVLHEIGTDRYQAFLQSKESKYMVLMFKGPHCTSCNWLIYETVLISYYYDSVPEVWYSKSVNICLDWSWIYVDCQFDGTCRIMWCGCGLRHSRIQINLQKGQAVLFQNVKGFLCIPQHNSFSICVGAVDS